MNLINIYDADRREISLASLGLHGLKLIIPSPSYSTTAEKVEGTDGFIVLDRVLNPRKLIAEFYSKAIDYESSLILRNELFGILGNGQVFFVSETKQPSKQWKVYLDEWKPERINTKVHTFEIPLTAMSGTSESISEVSKTFNESTFRFKNEGNVVIDPRTHSETEITFTGVSTNLTITNNTNENVWSYTGSTVAGDVVTLRGVRSLKNDVSIFGNTNKRLISLDAGWNDFSITGASGTFTLTIRTRFYFL